MRSELASRLPSSATAVVHPVPDRLGQTGSEFPRVFVDGHRLRETNGRLYPGVGKRFSKVLRIDAKPDDPIEEVRPALGNPHQVLDRLLPIDWRSIRASDDRLVL